MNSAPDSRLESANMGLKTVNKWLAFLATALCYFPIAAMSGDIVPKLVSKEPVQYQPSSVTALDSFAAEQPDSLCLEDCKRRSQHVSMGIEAIMENCRRHCRIASARSMIKSDDPAVRLKGTRILCEIADKSSVPDLIELLKKDMQDRTGVWAEIIPALGRTRDERAAPLLMELSQLVDDDWLGRAMAVAALGEIGSPVAIDTLIKVSSWAETRESAIKALAQIDDVRAAPTLVSVIQPEEDEATRNAAITGLSKLGSAAIPAIREEYLNYSTENRQTQKRVWLCQVLGKIGSDEALKILKQSYDDPDEMVRDCARKQL
jgi:HEAT repeat protein